MAVILWAMGLFLVIQGCLCSLGQTDSGCRSWDTEKSGGDVCCDACHPGNRMVKKCGPVPKDLCTPCLPGTFSVKPQSYKCERCTQCVGAQVLLKECTATTDTECGCKEGLLCGDERCSHCVDKCGKGKEPIETGLCRPCPNGTFNDQENHKCKAWSTKCPNPNQVKVYNGDASNDIKCENVSVIPDPKPPAVSAVADSTEDEWPVALFVVPTIVLAAFITTILIIITVVVKILLKRQEKRKKRIDEEHKTIEETMTKTQIIRTPTDDPCTLVAIECSFHEAQQEQGSSSESLASKDSSDPLIA